MKELKYTEGPEAIENFERLAMAILQAPKSKIKAKKQQPKAATSRKPTNAHFGHYRKPGSGSV